MLYPADEVSADHGLGLRLVLRLQGLLDRLLVLGLGLVLRLLCRLLILRMCGLLLVCLLGRSLMGLLVLALVLVLCGLLILVLLLRLGRSGCRDFIGLACVAVPLLILLHITQGVRTCRAFIHSFISNY